MHLNQLVEGIRIQKALTTLFKVDQEEGACFCNMEFEDTQSNNFHLDMIFNFAQAHGFDYLGTHLVRLLKSQTGEAFLSGFKVYGKICAICKIKGKYYPCILDRKGCVVEPLDTGLDIGTDLLKGNVLYGWYVFRKE